MHFLKGNCIKGDQCRYLHERSKNDLEFEIESKPQKMSDNQGIFQDNQKLSRPPNNSFKREFIEKTDKSNIFKGKMHSDFAIEEEMKNESNYSKNTTQKMQISPPHLNKYTKPPFKMNIQKRGRSNEEEEEAKEDGFPNRNNKKEMNYQNEEEMERKPRIFSTNNLNNKNRQNNSNTVHQDESHSPSLPILKKKLMKKKMEADSELREISPSEPNPNLFTKSNGSALKYKPSLTNNNNNNTYSIQQRAASEENLDKKATSQSLKEKLIKKYQKMQKGEEIDRNTTIVNKNYANNSDIRKDNQAFIKKKNDYQENKEIEEKHENHRKFVNPIKIEISSEEEESQIKDGLMCSEREIEIREMGRQLDVFEIDPKSSVNGEWIAGGPKAKKEWCLKKYARSDAGKEYEIPFPMSKLKLMLDYLIEKIIDVDNRKDVPYYRKNGVSRHCFYDIYDFVYDRFRAINKDLTVHNKKTKKKNIEVMNI